MSSNPSESAQKMSTRIESIWRSDTDGSILAVLAEVPCTFDLSVADAEQSKWLLNQELCNLVSADTLALNCNIAR